jgi:hypothetical protein
MGTARRVHQMVGRLHRVGERNKSVKRGGKTSGKGASLLAAGLPTTLLVTRSPRRCL